MIEVKYIGGVNVTTPFGLVKAGQILEVPEAVAEKLSPAAWEVVEKEATKKEKKEGK